MPSFFYNAGVHAIQNGAKDFLTDTLKFMLVQSSYTPDRDHAVMTTPAASELSVSGYAGGFSGAGRKTLGSKTVTKDDTNDRSRLDAADPSVWSALAAGQTIGGMIAYFHDTSDAVSIPLAFLDGTDTPTNGGDFTAQLDALGIGYAQM